METQLCVRDLLPGMHVLVTETEASEISAVDVMNGSNGEAPAMIGGSDLKSAMAVRISFKDREPIIVHPARQAWIRD